MEQTYAAKVNDVLVELFNKVLKIEQLVLQDGEFNDVSITEIHTLEAIGKDGGSMSEIAAKLGVTVGTLTTAVNKLIEKGYVTRDRSESDKRIVKVNLLRKGELVNRTHRMFHYNMIYSATDDLNEEGKIVMLEALEKVLKFINESYHQA